MVPPSLLKPHNKPVIGKVLNSIEPNEKKEARLQSLHHLAPLKAGEVSPPSTAECRCLLSERAAPSTTAFIPS